MVQYIHKNALREFGDRNNFFMCIERGNENDLEFIKEYIEKDPKKLLFLIKIAKIIILQISL